MSAGKPSQNADQPRSNNAWEDAKRRVRDRNDEVRRAGKQQRDETERRSAAAQRARDLRDGVSR